MSFMLLAPSGTYLQIACRRGLSGDSHQLFLHILLTCTSCTRSECGMSGTSSTLKVDVAIERLL